MRRKILIAVFGLLVLGGAASALHWYYVASRLESGFQAWIAQRRAQGWSVRVGALGRGGGVLSPTLTVHAFEISGGEPTIPGGVGWLSPRLLLRVDLFDPWHVNIVPEGLQQLRLPDGGTLSVQAETLEIDLAGGTAPDRLVVEVDTAGLRVESTALDTGHRVLTARAAEGRLELMPAANAGEPVATFSVTGTDIKLPDGIRWPLGRLISALSLDGTVLGPLPDAVAPRLAAAAWRDGGGSVEVQVQALTWGPLTATGSATLALDDALQPMGAGTGHIVGYQGTFDALGSTGVLTHSAVKAAKAVLSLMAGVPGGPGGREQQSVDVPLTLQFRTLSMRQIPLLLLPEVEWAGP